MNVYHMETSAKMFLYLTTYIKKKTIKIKGEIDIFLLKNISSDYLKKRIVLPIIKKVERK